MRKSLVVLLLLFALLLFFEAATAQQITGAWRGKINNQRVELKIIQKGDSLTGTSYYYGLMGNFKRYSIKGYFDQNTNSVVWWDDELITAKGASVADNRQLSVADFNCPGSGRMFLDGKSSKKETPRTATGEVSLTKVDHPSFHDEWDIVLVNWTQGGNDPHIIDSVNRIAVVRKSPPANPVTVPPTVKPPPVVSAPPVAKAMPAPAAAPTVQKILQPAKPPTIEELFTTRKKTFVKEIPLVGDSIELHFYDNAEVDGDSITLYLNNKMIFSHIRLTGNPFIITLSVNELATTNELVMVAENLGSIPPNTAFMIAVVDGKRYEAYLESTEGSSSLIKFTKKSNRE